MLPAAGASASGTTRSRPQNRFRRRVPCRKPGTPPDAEVRLHRAAPCGHWGSGAGMLKVGKRPLPLDPAVGSAVGALVAVTGGLHRHRRRRGYDGTPPARSGRRRGMPPWHHRRTGPGTAPCLAGPAQAEAGVDDLGVVGIDPGCRVLRRPPGHPGIGTLAEPMPARSSDRAPSGEMRWIPDPGGFRPATSLEVNGRRRHLFFSL